MAVDKINVLRIINNGNLVRKLNTNINNVHSEAYLYRSFGRYYVIRKIGKQYKLSLRKLLVLEKNLHTYYKLLNKKLDIRLPRVFLSYIDSKQNVILLATEYFPKGNITEIISSRRKLLIFKSIILSIIKLTNNKKNISRKKLICSIDVNPRNFYLDSFGTLVYNDFAPPFYRKNNKWIEFRRHDELHIKKSEKEMRYFTGLNLLLTFINKTRIQLTFNDYLKFIRWTSKEIIKSDLTSTNNIRHFADVLNSIHTKKLKQLSKFTKSLVLRDILRFALSFRSDLTCDQVAEIYRKSKNPDGLNILIKKLYEKNKSSNNRDWQLR